MEDAELLAEMALCQKYQMTRERDELHGQTYQYEREWPSEGRPVAGNQQCSAARVLKVAKAVRVWTLFIWAFMS